MHACILFTLSYIDVNNNYVHSHDCNAQFIYLNSHSVLLCTGSIDALNLVQSPHLPITYHTLTHLKLALSIIILSIRIVVILLYFIQFIHKKSAHYKSHLYHSPMTMSITVLLWIRPSRSIGSTLH